MMCLVQCQVHSDCAAMLPGISIVPMIMSVLQHRDRPAACVQMLCSCIRWAHLVPLILTINLRFHAFVFQIKQQQGARTLAQPLTPCLPPGVTTCEGLRKRDFPMEGMAADILTSTVSRP